MRKLTISVIAAIALFGGALASQASDTGQTLPNTTQEQNVLNDSGFGQALTSENLDVESGRQETSIDTLNMQVSNATLSGYLGENYLGGISVTGSNLMSNVNANGMNTFIQNSGNQCLIQENWAVNVMVQ